MDAKLVVHLPQRHIYFQPDTTMIAATKLCNADGFSQQYGILFLLHSEVT